MLSGSCSSNLFRASMKSFSHGSYIAAVCGHIFASPGPSQVRRGIDLVDNDKG